MKPTARDRAQAIVRDYLAGHFEIEGAAERIIDAILDAERAAAERMRESCAQEIERLCKTDTVHLYAYSIRALPLEGRCPVT